MGNVVLSKCDSYDKDRVLRGITEIFNLLGGIEKYIKPGMQVALKPNLLIAKKPEAAATTHPMIVETVARLVMQAGGIVTIIDSPGGPYGPSWLKRTFQSTGMEAAADATGAKLNGDYRVETVPLENAILLKSVNLLKPLIDADIIINLAKLKTHMMMVYTGAIKNMFGAVGGTEKADFHARMNNYDDFAKALVDIHYAVKPTLNIIDGVTGMEGEGPGSGIPRRIGVIIAAENPFEADAVALDIIGVPHAKVPVMRVGLEHGLYQPENITILGEDKATFFISDFDVPSLHLRESGAKPDKNFLSRLGGFTRPKLVIRTADCIRCKKCLEACPAHTIHIEADKTIKIHTSDCIRCFCCHELCPENAIDIQRPFLSRLLMGENMTGRHIQK